MDELYLEKVKNGEVNAFSYFVRTYKEGAFGMAFSVLKNTLDAEDAVQEAFIKVYKNLASFKMQSKFSTWLYKIVINEAYKKLRTDKKLKYMELTDKEAVNIEVHSASIESEELKHYVSLCVEALPADFSLVLDLFYLKEYSITEICEITSWSLSKVKVSLHRARNQFYAEMNKILKNDIKTLHYLHN